jgi:ribosomal protein S27AE
MTSKLETKRRNCGQIVPKPIMYDQCEVTSPTRMPCSTECVRTLTNLTDHGIKSKYFQCVLCGNLFFMAEYTGTIGH